MKTQQFSVSVLAVLLVTVLAAPHATNDHPALSVRGVACGSKGYDLGTESFDDFTNATYDTCSKACLKQSKKCRSFAFGGNSECYLYAVSVAENLEADGTSPYAFYDVACVSSNISSMSSTTTTSTIKTPTTTKTPSTLSSSTSTTSPSSSTTKPISSATTQSQRTSSNPSVSSSAPTRSSNITTSTSRAITSTSLTVSKASTTTSTSAVTSSKSSSSAVSSSSTTIRSTASVSGPPCGYPTWTITNFQFYNSSHNLDCTPGGRDVNTKYCEPYQTPQPEGYGPVDSVYADVAGISNCYSQQPSFYPPQRPVGGGHVVCGLPARGSNLPEPDNFHFYGSSIMAKSNALFQIKNNITCSDGRYFMAYGEVSAPMECTYDSGNNATCILNPGTVSVPATRFDSVGP